MIPNTHYLSNHAFRSLFPLFVPFLFAVLPASPVLGSDFDTGRLTSNSLKFRLNDGSSKDYSKNSADFSLTGTGLSGTVIDGGDHWTISITGGNLAGRISSGTGVEIRLNGNTVVLSNTKTEAAIQGDGGVKIVGPGVLHVDQLQNSAIKSGAIGTGVTTIVLGACVAVNSLGGGTGVLSYDGIRIAGASLHVNSEGKGIYCDSGPVSIVGSIITVNALGDAMSIAGGTSSTAGSLTVSGSCIHLGGGTAANGLRWNTKGDISVSDSVFCAGGGECGIGGKIDVVSQPFSARFDNVVGAFVGGQIGLYNWKNVSVSGGASKLSIVGNAYNATDGEGGHRYKRGQAAFPSGLTSSSFSVSGGRVDLFAPGNHALLCGTNVVTAGKLNVLADPDFGDFRTLFTLSGAVSAAGLVAGSLAFDSDILFTDAMLAQAMESFWTPGMAALTVDEAKASTGIRTQDMFVTGGRVEVTASETGVHLGIGTSPTEGFLDVEGGAMDVESDGVAIMDWNAAAGYTDREEDGSLIWLSGGRLSARGRLDGILTCGGVLMDGGTLEAAATGGSGAGSIPDKPGLRGYALSANNGFAIDGGSFVASAGELRTVPTTSSSHGFANVFPCDLAVPGAPSDKAVVVSDMVPAWYGTNGLYPIGGRLRFWLPTGAASLAKGGVSYTADVSPVLRPGVNEFAPSGEPLLPSDGDLHVDAATGSDANDGRSWETAKATIQAAIDASEEGDLIYVNDGTYGPIATDGKKLEIVSVGGAERTIIDAAGNGRCATLTDVTRPALDDPMDVATVLRGFTLCNGNSVDDGGGAVGGLLADCVLRDNRTDYAGGGAAASTLVRCIVRDNAAPNGSGGGTIGCDLTDCLVWNNTAALPGGGISGMWHSAVNCTIVGNASGSQGGGMGNAVFATNCIVWGNSAPESPDIHGCDEWHLCSPVVDPGCGSISDNPLFVNAERGDFRLRPMSPCIDAGADIRGEGETDLDGNPRIRGPSVDMGAYERIPPTDRDFDGDGRADPVLFKGGTWSVAASSLGRYSASFGSGDCLPVPADYDGDGTTDLSVYDTVTGDWWIRYSSGGWKQDNFGSLTCKPYPADYDGDGIADLSVWDGRTGDWFIRYSSGCGPNGMSWAKDNFGSLSCIPVPADYDGDGKADLSVRDNATGDWWTRYSRGLNGRSWSGDNFGSTVCDPYPADYDGDGLADLSVYDQQTGDWFVRYSSGLGPNGMSWTQDNFGMKTCIPVPADYDGDGLADFAVFDTATSTFWVRYSGGGWTSVGF